MGLIFNESNCEVISISDITTFKLLEQKEKTNRLLMALNATVHHEMLAPLKANSDASKFLSLRLEDERDRELAYSIHISTQLLLNHMHDLLDQSVISNDGFKPVYIYGVISEPIREVILMIR